MALEWQSLPPFGDYIGCESCADMIPSTDQIGVVDSSEKKAVKKGQEDMQIRDRKQQRLLVKDKGQFPPPIPSLARTENLLCRMPWILRRHHTSDGRLILSEERVQYHEYFRAHRSGGRLTLHLVPLNDDGVDLPVAVVDDPQSSDAIINRSCYEDEIEKDNSIDDDDSGADPALENEECNKDNSAVAVNIGGTSSGGRDWKCLYSTYSPCLFGVAMPTLEPVLV